ncbi:putative aldo-keto reductase [Talaromyces proteolyticus]|uniref:D-xylose reductase [NAD(P)H] n=1 Tax=Talaromyces proteolyticus TaxID=1131652 RepID=A0AAD4L4R6_9EURO|nr:putative aldo-keto reductase [Talaromyces proteolyticus]KAH8705016.1 putative aldo-keto reductase [Talaromyces proteolyticus]
MTDQPNPICRTTFKLNNGASIPAVGLGTWQGRPGSQDAQLLRETIIHALRGGYRLIDTAQSYGVEDIVGSAIRASGVARHEITVVTKLVGAALLNPAAALQKSLNQLNLEYIDLFLMHWPQALTPDGSRPYRPDERPTFMDSWKLMEKLVEPGSATARQCRAIGVSNFTEKTLNTLLEEATVVPAVNQIELHAFNPALNLVPFCHKHGIQVMSWSTLGSRQAPEILTDEPFTTLAQKHNTSPAVISLSWCVQRGVVVVPMSGNPTRIDENIRLITLPDEDVETMNNAYKTRRVRLSDANERLRFDVPGKGRLLMGWTNVEFGFEDEQGNWLN